MRRSRSGAFSRGLAFALALAPFPLVAGPSVAGPDLVRDSVRAPEAAPPAHRIASDLATVPFGDFFSYAPPPGWGWTGESSFGLSQKERGVYGDTLHGPVAGVVPTRISLHYYAPGNLLHDTIEVYLRRFSQPILGPVEGNEYGPLRKATVAGREATIFERKKNEFVPRPGATEPSNPRPGIHVRREMRADPVPIIERFVVFRGDSGFYALRYTAPAEHFTEFLPVFERVTESFRALR